MLGCSRVVLLLVLVAWLGKTGGSATSSTDEGKLAVIGERYLLCRMLGEGITASVWEACDQVDGRRVAIKLYGGGGVWDVPREVEALERLQHPAIPNVLDWNPDRNSESGWVWWVMDLVDGVPLSDEGFVARLGRKHTAAILASLLGLVEYLEGQGLYHGDLHGGNLIIDTQGSLHLVDFGRWQPIEGQPNADALNQQLRRLLHLVRGFLGVSRESRQSRHFPRPRRPGLHSFCALVEGYTNSDRGKLAPDWLQQLQKHPYLDRRCDPDKLAALVACHRRRLDEQSQRERP